ncbi:phosphatidylglycerol lysyltransferase domain-containing protein [Sphaerisporangium fuscum]|uniref:phosphatidylglycerol lysyltransferase domain-containing protein n=1 Tax=Sphaerisporangium fuscum TaxID=2835868 RepID=UPI001BDD8E29|nr:phosphatidylglycerol lysyltransferase domain-containing protein [Sphaerisporangium fuscum]
MKDRTPLSRVLASRSWVPAAAGYAALAIGILDIIRGVVPHFRRSRVEAIASVFPGTVTTLAAAASILVGVLLVMIAHALRRRKVRAWRAVVVLLPLGALIEALHWRKSAPAVISILLFIVLIINRREFHALSDPRSRWRALWNFLALGLLDIAIGWVIVSIHPMTMVGDPSAGERLQHVVLGLFGMEGPVQYSLDRTSDLVYYSLAGLGALTAITTLYLLLRPERPVAALSPDDEQRLRELLARHGSLDSLGYFALRRDKSVIFSPSGKAAIAYRVVAGVMLASGDPIGDIEAWPGAIKRFMEEAGRHAWVPAVIGCGETGGEVWTREAGLSALEIGDEAIVEVADFTLEGRAMRNVRQMVKRTERAGYTCLVRRVGDLTDEEKDQIRRAADFWRGTETERGFSMALGRFGDPADDECVVVTAHKASEDGQDLPGDDIRAVLNFVPWGKNGMSLDLMRRDRGADPGLNELLIVKALQAAPSLGVTRVSLNFAMFRSALARGERLGAGPVLRAWRGILVFLSRWFQIESLYKFNAKFRPFWEPRFLVYPTARDLPRIGVSALQAEAFLTVGMPKLPLPGKRHRRPEATVSGAAGSGSGSPDTAQSVSAAPGGPAPATARFDKVGPESGTGSGSGASGAKPSRTRATGAARAGAKRSGGAAPVGTPSGGGRPDNAASDIARSEAPPSGGPLPVSS